MQWTEQMDEFLVFYGYCLYMALGSQKGAMSILSRNDFPGIPPEQLAERLAHLKETRADWCAALEAYADIDPTSPPTKH
jgi:hypothetical protein